MANSQFIFLLVFAKYFLFWFVNAGRLATTLQNPKILKYLGRFKNIEIEGLLIADFGKTFGDSLKRGYQVFNLSEEEILQKIAPKLNELLGLADEETFNLYLDKHKFNLENFLKPLQQPKEDG